MRAKAEEEARMGASGDGAAAARRWTGVRGVIEARSLLKTLFRTASHYKAQARAHSEGRRPERLHAG